MTIEKLYGLRATNITLHDRFTMLASAAPDRPRPQQPRRPLGVPKNSLNLRNRYLIAEIARQLERQSKINALRQRLGYSGGMRRFGSETSLVGMRRSNSFGNLSQQGYNRPWRNRGNLSRSASFNNLSQMSGQRPYRRGFYRRGYGGNRGGWFRFRGNINQAVNRVFKWNFAHRGQQQRGRGQRGQGRGGMLRKQQQKPVPTKEELDHQLDEYMASTKSALDRELEEYMRNAENMDLN